ncbi:MAG: hypothetical protein OK422_02050 [Thaumarchaeota archaeon]|nr:hypothetical protein [Nitrososphaerota archaeon]
MAITPDDIILSLIGAFVGLAVTLPVTYLVVDRIIERNERKRLAPLEKMAKERLRSKLGVGSLTTLLITLVIDIRAALEDKRAIPKDVAQLYISKLKSSQSDLEMLIGVYNQVLTVELTHATSGVIAQIEHLQEDVQFMVEIYPRPPTATHVAHTERVILVTVQLTKRELDLLGEDDEQIKALEAWLTEYGEKKAVAAEPEEPVMVSGKHELI